MYTALQSFEPVFKANPNMKLILLPDIQETSDVPCDTGSDPEVLRKEIEEKGLPVDASFVTDGWNVKVHLFLFFFLVALKLCLPLFFPALILTSRSRYNTRFIGRFVANWISLYDLDRSLRTH